jgi:hypothetical protein
MGFRAVGKNSAAGAATAVNGTERPTNGSMASPRFPCQKSRCHNPLFPGFLWLRSAIRCSWGSRIAISRTPRSRANTGRNRDRNRAGRTAAVDWKARLICPWKVVSPLFERLELSASRQLPRRGSPSNRYGGCRSWMSARASRRALSPIASMPATPSTLSPRTTIGRQKKSKRRSAGSGVRREAAGRLPQPVPLVEAHLGNVGIVDQETVVELRAQSLDRRVG